MADAVRRAQVIVSMKDEISGAAGGAANGLDKVDRSSTQSKTALDRVSESSGKLQKALGDLTKIGFAALTTAIVSGVKSAADLQTSMSSIAALTDTPRSAIQGLTQDVIAMSREVPVSANELAKGLYFISSSGFQGAEAMDILRSSAKAAAAGLGETKTIADAVTSAMNAYKLEGKDAARITDILTAAVREGKGEPDALAGALGRVLPVAAAAGVSMEQVAASMATMTRTGLSAEESATALRGVIGALLAPSKQSKDALAEIGLSVEDVADKLRGDGLVSLLQLLMERTHGNVEALDAIIPNVRALTGVLSTAGSQGDDYAKVLLSMQNAAGITDQAFSEMANTFEFKFKRAQNSFDNFWMVVGEKMLPALSDAADAATILISGQDQINDAFKNTSRQILETKDSYKDYRESLIAVAEAAQKITEDDMISYQTSVERGFMDEADVAEELARKIGLLSETQWAAQHSAAALANEMEGGLVQYKNWGKANEDVTYQSIATEKQLKAQAKATKEAMDAAAEATISQSKFAESFKEFDAAKGAQMTIEALEEKIKANPEAREKYAAQIRAIKEQFGIITPAAEEASRTFRILEELWSSGQISTTSYAKALGKIQTAAKDSSVSVDELGLKAGEAAAYMKAATEGTVTETDKLVNNAKEQKVLLMDQMGNSLSEQQTSLSTAISEGMISITNSMTTATSVVQTGVNTLRLNAIVPLTGDLGKLKQAIANAESQAKTSASGIKDAWKQVPSVVTTTYKIKIEGSVPNGATPTTATSGHAQGAVIAGATGFITQSPTYLLGEGGYSTFAGQGAEGVIPLNDRGINILAEALARAFERMPAPMTNVYASPGVDIVTKVSRGIAEQTRQAKRAGAGIMGR